MLVHELFEDQWSGPDNAWHNQDGGDQWYDGNDQWHGQSSGNMIEDITTDKPSLSDIIAARDLIIRATRNPGSEKQRYFDFLKHLRNKHSAEYSTQVHQHAAKLVKQG